LTLRLLRRSSLRRVFSQQELRRTVLLGELGLDGRLRPVRVLPATFAAQQAGFTRVIVPMRQSGEGSRNPLSGSTICAWPNLGGVAFACTIGMMGKIRKRMSTTKCVCAAMPIEKEAVLYLARVRRRAAAASESLGFEEGLA
jgi:hypothetical protein